MPARTKYSAPKPVKTHAVGGARRKHPTRGIESVSRSTDAGVRLTDVGKQPPPTDFGPRGGAGSHALGKKQGRTLTP